MVEGERTLAAIMFTDIVGYTHLSQVDESLAIELLEEHRSLLRPIIAAHRGSVVKTMGDAFLVEFKSALEAVRCAVEIQDKLRARNRTEAPSRKLEIRIGIHVGDVVREKDDIIGDAVNVASRIEPLAEPGGVCISQQVYDQVRNRTELELVKAGDVALKNVGLPVGVYSVVRPSDPKTEDGSKRGNRVVVLPFVSISPGSNEEYFADGLTEELILKLSENPDLRVIARTSAMSYKGKGKKVSEIGRELGVDSLIEGSVRKAGNRVRISVQLIDARTEEHLWSDRYDRELTDIFAIQSHIATKVAHSLAAGIFSGSKADTRDVEAYTLYLRAGQLQREGTEASIREAISLYKRAITRDPDFARAYVGLGRAWGMMAATGYEDFPKAAAEAEAAASKALELRTELAESHSVMAMVHFLNDRSEAALEEAEETLRINPNDVEAHMSLAILYSCLRTPEEALRESRRAYELDPLSIPAANLFAAAAGVAGLGEVERDVLSRLVEFNPRNPRVYVDMAEFEMSEKNFAEAQKLIDAAREFGPGDHSVKFAQGELFALTGRRKDAEKVLSEIRTEEKKESARLMGELVVLTALGNLDEVFKVILRQAELHSWPYMITSDPYYAEVRRDPRFQGFRRKVGLPVPTTAREG